MVLEARPVDDAPGRLRDRGLDERASGRRRSRRGSRSAQVEVAEQVEARPRRASPDRRACARSRRSGGVVHAVPTASEHTLDQRDEDHRGHEVGGRPGVERVARLAQRGVEALQRLPRRCARRRRRARRARPPTPAPPRRRRACARSACRVPRSSSRRCSFDDRRRAPARPSASAAASAGTPVSKVSAKSVTYSEAIESRSAALAIASRKPISGSERTSCSTRSRRPPAPARRIAAYASRASATSSARSVAPSRSRSGPPRERGLRQRREQQHDAEVRVRGRDAARRLDGREDRLTDAALAGAPQLGADRDRAAQHVLVGHVVEVVARRDVARLLRAGLEHARQLGGTGDALGATNGRLRAYVREPA